MNKKCVGCGFLVLSVFVFLLLISLQVYGESVKLKVSSEQANIREKPDIGSAIILQISQGTILESLRKEGEWHLVKCTTEEGTTVSGYVHESLVIVLEPETEEEKIEKIKKPEIKEPKKILPKAALKVTIIEKPRESKFGFSLAGGGNYVSGGDLNAGAQGLSHYYSAFFSTPEIGEIKATHLGFVIAGDIFLSLSPRLSLGVSVDYFESKKSSSAKYEKGSALNTLSVRPQIRALPISLFISYSPFPPLYIKGGVEYYFARCNYFYRIEQGERWQEWRGKADAWGLGFEGGVGVRWKFSSNLALFLEAMDRYAKVKGFEGKDTSVTSEGITHTEDGRLYFFQLKIAEENTYPLLFIREKKPTEAGVSEVRDATLNLSSVSLRLGIRIFF
jgi:hypothetical protein